LEVLQRLFVVREEIDGVLQGDGVELMEAPPNLHP
jgi:hypothetical protein